jgi:hypothetical protein
MKPPLDRPPPLPAPFATQLGNLQSSVPQNIAQQPEAVYNNATVPRADNAQANLGWQPGQSLSSSGASSGYVPPQYDNFASGGSVRGPMDDTDSVRIALAIARAYAERNELPYMQ